MDSKELKSLLQEVKQLKENLQNIESSVNRINYILQTSLSEERKKALEAQKSEQVEQELDYKCSNCPPFERGVSSSDYAPTERYDYYEQHDTEWLAYHKRGGKW